MAKGFYVQEGKTLDYINDGSQDIAYCDVVVLTSRVGIAASDIPKGSKGAVSVSGVYELPADTAAFTMGQELYWDADNEKAVATAGAIKCGIAPAGKEAAGASVLVKIG